VAAEAILTGLARAHLVASAAIVLVLLLRPLLLRWLGASVAYWLWLVVPIAAAMSFLPARERIVVIPASQLVTDAREDDSTAAAGTAAAEQTFAGSHETRPPSSAALAELLVAAWLIGAAALLGRSIVSTRRLAADPAIGPALVGVLRPRLVLPADFETRFDAQERALILAHEHVHRASGHAIVNALIEVARCASWFNPLVHLAATRARLDQELACDAAVIAAHPTTRRVYAQALLKTQIASAFLPLGCTWTSRSGKRLGERIALLGRPSLSRRGAVAGAAAVGVVGVALGYAAWAQQPERVVTQAAAATRPPAVWTPSADAPEHTLSHKLEEQRHDFFIKLAQKGDIDIVFFGTTDTEMWWWPDRGRKVWDRTFESLKAANFGSQGTQPRSLLWRMQNGELDGYQAKLVVLYVAFCFAGSNSSAVDRFDAIVPNCTPIVAEVRARQPQAKILLVAPFPRGQQGRDDWRQLAKQIAAAFAPLVDERTVFYTDIGERFFRADGTHNQELWRYPPISGLSNVGIQPAAFELWAEQIQPWLDRFVR
jgi:beta-lactamase regulating signal transducer with metallopeptidase domain